MNDRPVLAAGQIGTTTLESWDTPPGAQHPTLVARATLNVRTGTWKVEPLPSWPDNLQRLLPLSVIQRDGIALSARSEEGARLALRSITTACLWMLEQHRATVEELEARFVEAAGRGDQVVFDLD